MFLTSSAGASFPPSRGTPAWTPPRYTLSLSEPLVELVGDVHNNPREETCDHALVNGAGVGRVDYMENGRDGVALRSTNSEASASCLAARKGASVARGANIR